MMTNVVHAAGGLGLFLLGMWVMTTGLRDLAGASLTRWLTRFTRSPLSGAVTGATVTAIVQSSSATTLAAIGFVSAGLLTFPQALGILFGANVGTTVTGWLVALLGFKLDLGEIAPIIVLIGVLLHMIGKGRVAAIGLAIAGFGLVFVGIETLRQGMAAFEGSLTPSSFPPDTWFGRWKLLLLGAVVTLITQSSSAGVATAIAAVHAGALTLPQAAAVVVGMDIGTTGTAMMSAIGASTQARRTAASHVIYNAITGTFAFLSIPLYVVLVRSFGDSTIVHQPEVALVAFHTLFNLAGVVAVLPVAGAFARLIERLIPERGTGGPRRLDRSLLRSLPVAIESANRVVRRLASELFLEVAHSLRSPGKGGLGESVWMSALADVRGFLGDLTSSPADGDLHRRHVAMIHVVDHLDRLFQRRTQRIRSGDPGDDALRRERSRLATSFLGAVGALRENVPLAESSALERWRGTRRFHEPYRRHLLRAGVADEIDDREVLGRIDEARRLGRIAYHLWRLTNQLDAAASPPTSSPSPPPTPVAS